jgi:hypothetical protein
MTIGNPRWPPLQDTLLTQDYMGKYRNILLSETTELIEPKLYMDGPLQITVFCSSLIFNMAARANNVL